MFPYKANYVCQILNICQLSSSLTWTGRAAQSWAHRQEYWTVPGTASVCSFCPLLPQTPAFSPEPVAASAACRWAGTSPPPHIWCCTAAAGCCPGAGSPEASGSPGGERTSERYQAAVTRVPASFHRQWQWDLKWERDITGLCSSSSFKAWTSSVRVADIRNDW